MEFHEHRLIKLWEYELQLTFRTVNLHISGAWRLQDDAAVAAHHERGFRLNGPVVYSWFPLDALGKTTNVDEILSGAMPSIDWRNFLFSIGSLDLPVSLAMNHFMLCHVAVGVMGTQDLSSGAWRVPEHLSSLVSMEPSISDDLKVTVVVRQSDQVLPVGLVEVAFEPLFIELPRINCEMCEVEEAHLYCPADRAHLCAMCDTAHHSISALFSKHKRVPVEQSPSQFGKCPDHPMERLECVCLDCLDLLCSHCVLLGSHAALECKSHRLISTVECFKAAMMRTSPADIAAKETTTLLTEKLESRHQELTDIYCNFDQLQHRLNNILQSCCGSIDAIQKRRVGYLQALRRQLLCQLLSIEWFESHMAHARLALPPGEYLIARDRHVLLVRSLFENASVDTRNVPPWMLEQLGVEGNLDVVLDAVDAPPRPTAEAQFKPTWQDLHATFSRPPLSGYELVLHPPAGDMSASHLPPTRDMHLVPTHLRYPANAGNRKVHLPPALETSVAFGDIHYPQGAGGALSPTSRMQAIDNLVHNTLLATEPQEDAAECANFSTTAPDAYIIARNLRAGSRLFGHALQYIEECPVEDRADVVSSMFQVLGVCDDGADQSLLQASVEDDLQRAGHFAGLMLSTRSVLSIILAGLLPVLDHELLFLEPLLSEMLARGAASREGTNDAASALFQSLERFVQKLVQTAASVPNAVLSIMHSVRTVAGIANLSRDVTLGVVASCMLTRIVAPQMIRLAQRSFCQSAIEPLPEFVSWFSRWMQKIADCGTIEHVRPRHEEAPPDEKFTRAMSATMLQYAANVLSMKPPETNRAVIRVSPSLCATVTTRFVRLLHKHFALPIARSLLENSQPNPADTQIV